MGFEEFIVRADGKTGIGRTVGPQYLLHVNGSAGKPIGGSWTSSSDRRLKTNIKSFNKGLGLINKVNPITFQYNGKLNYSTEEEYVGVIAQELKEIASFMVSKFQGQMVKFISLLTQVHSTLY